MNSSTGISRSVLLGLTVGMAWFGEPGHTAPPSIPLPNRYRCTVETLMYQGSSQATLRYISTTQQRVWRWNNAYRVEQVRGRTKEGRPESAFTPEPKSSQVTLNNGDGTDSEFYYRPEERRAKPSLEAVQIWFAKRYPARWRARYGDRQPQVACSHQLEIFDPKTPTGNPSAKIDPVSKLAKLFGKPCRIYQVTFHPLTSVSGTTNPKEWIIARHWKEERTGLTLRSDTIMEALGGDGKPVRVLRAITTTRELQLDPPKDASLLELPAGTTCEVYDYPLRLPPGVIRRQVSGPGIEL